MPENQTNYPPVSIAIIPVVFLVVALTINIAVYGDDAISGSSQIILIACAAFAATLAVLNGKRWQDLEKGVVGSIRIAIPAILILLMVGALSGTWLVSGIIPTMIYYGLHLLSPTFFLFASCVICILVSVFTGSSWTTSATVGIALIGIGQILGVHPGMVAGAILSGAYFGDKMSPLSDTTNLASGTTGTELFTHIRYMCYTTVPSIGIAIVLFLLIGFSIDGSGSLESAERIQQALVASVNITPWLLLVPAAVVFMIVKKISALPALFIGTLLGAVFAFIFQPEIVKGLGDGADSTGIAAYTGIMQVLFGDSSIVTGNSTLDELLTAGGMSGMLTTIWLILSAMVYGGIMEGSGFLRSITESLIRRVKSAGGLVSATAGTCVFFNVTASDQYLSVVLPGRMYSQAYKERGLAPENLSRTIEDSGTVTSVLVPWNTCGAFHAGVLGVATLSYLPFAFFCFISPLMTIVVAYLQFKIARVDS